MSGSVVKPNIRITAVGIVVLAATRTVPALGPRHRRRERRRLVEALAGS